MCVHINHLSHDLLSYLFDFLSDKEILKIEIICKKWQISVRKLLSRKKSFNWKNHHFECFAPAIYGGSCKYIVDDNNSHIFGNIILKCPNIKHLDFSWTHLNGKFLLSIINLCPKLESIKWSNHIDITDNQFEQFTKIIGHKLIEWSCFQVNFAWNKMLFEKFEKIEKILIKTKNQQEDKQLFYYLNSNCPNLISLKWGGSYIFHDIEIDENMFNVIQRMKILQVLMGYFVRFNFNSFNNLTELMLRSAFEETQITFDCNKINEITFNNLRKLVLQNLRSHDMDVISKFKLPKLEYFDCSSCYFNENLQKYYYDPSKHKSFFDQLNNMKTLKWCHTMDPDLLSSFDQLIHFECKFICSKNAIFIQNLNIIIKHESLKNIKIEYFDHSLSTNIFSGIINLFKAKPNSDITINIFCRKHLDRINQILLNIKKLLMK